MAETAESYCIRLKLNDGGQVYVESVWRSASFAITVLDGARAWSHSVTEMQVKDIARTWGISVSNFMRIARSHLSVQHPTATYFLILADTCTDTIQLSCTMHDVWDGDLLKLEVRLKKMQNLGAVVFGMLDLLIDTTSNLKERIINTEDGKRRQAQQVILDIQKKISAPNLKARVMLDVEQINTEDGKRRQLARQVLLRHPEKNPCTRFESQSDVGCPEDAAPVQESEAAGSILMRFSRDRSEDQLSPYSQPPRRLNIREKSKISILQPPELQMLGNSIEATTTNYTDMDMDTMSYMKLQRSTEGHHSRCSCHDVVIRERFEVPLSEHVIRVLNRLGPTKCRKESTTDRGHGQDFSEENKVAKDHLQGWGIVRSTDHLSSAHVEKPLQTSIAELCAERFKTVHVHDLRSTSCHRQGGKNLDDPGCVDASTSGAGAGDQRKKMPSSSVPTQCQTWYNSLVEDIPTSTAVECLGRKIKPFASSLPKILDTSNLTTKEQLTQPVDGSWSGDFSHGRIQTNEPPSNIPDGSPNIITPDGCNSTLLGVQGAKSSGNLPSHNCTDVKSIIDDSRFLESSITAPKSDVAYAACGGDASAQATEGGHQSSISEAWKESYEKRINPCASRGNIINTISRSAGNVRVNGEDMSRGKVVPSVHENYSRATPNHGNNLSISRADDIEDIGENEHSASMIADHHEPAVDGTGTDKKFNLLEKDGCVTGHMNVTNEGLQGSSHQSLFHRSTSYCKVTEKLHERQSSGADIMFERPCRRTSDSVSMKEKLEEDSGNTTSTGCFQIIRRPWTDTIAIIREEDKELNTIHKASTCSADDDVILDSLQLGESNAKSHREDCIPSGCGQEKDGIPIVGEDEEDDRSKQIEKKQSSIGDHPEYTFRNSFRLRADYIGQAQWKEWLQEAKTEEKEESWKESQESAATRDELSNKEFNAARNKVELEQFGPAEIRASIAERKGNEVDTNIPGTKSNGGIFEDCNLTLSGCKKEVFLSDHCGAGLNSPPFPEKADKTEQILEGNSNPKTRRNLRDTTRSEGKVKRQTELELLRMPVKEVKKEAIEEISRIRRHGTIAEQMALINSEAEKKKTRETKAKDDSNDHRDSHGTKDFSRKIPALGDVSKRKRKRTDLVPNHQVAKRQYSSGDIETDVPDADHYEFDKDRTESHVKINQVWALYDDIDGMPRNWAHIQRVVHFPQFKAWVSWLKPHNPSLQTVRWKESTGYTVPCGHFKAGKPDILTGINCFSHLMVVDWEANDVVHVYPRKGEVWALFKKGAMQHNSEGVCEKKVSKPEGRPKPIATPKFRLVEVLANIDGGSPVEIQVLGKVPGFRTIWGPFYAKGALPSNSIRLFSHRVPAYRLRGGENPKIPESCWDIDPAGLPPEDN